MRTFSGTTPLLPSPHLLRSRYHFAGPIRPEDQSSVKATRAVSGGGASGLSGGAAAPAAMADASAITAATVGDIADDIRIMRPILLWTILAAGLGCVATS